MINLIKKGIIKNQFLLQIILLLFCFMSNIKSLKIDTNKLNEVLLTQHNKYRKMHGVENLTLDNELIKLAQDYSAVLAYKDYVYAINPSGNKNKNKEIVGENIFTCTSILKERCYVESSTKPVDDWYNEIAFYNYDDPGFTLNTAHFTQVIWKATTKMGCGASVKTDGVTFKVVCNYYVAGNIVNANQYSENVLPLAEESHNNYLSLNYIFIFLLLSLY